MKDNENLAVEAGGIRAGHHDSTACGHSHGQDAHEKKDHAHGKACGCGHDHAHGEACGSGHDHAHGEACGCGHDHGNDEEAKKDVPRLVAALALFMAGMLLPVPPVVGTVLLLACYLVSGYPVLMSAVRSLGTGHMFDENFLMAIASLAAMAIGETREGCAVMLFYQVGECFQSFAVGRSRRQVNCLLYTSDAADE